ncbi:MAG TPA: DUF3068 domain-containing protein [Rugosimonospora sp.]|nr:DUF3068 domain-containing protein [Rugosimonospora sp.]
MKKRVIGAALFGTGLFLLAGAVCLAFLIVPQMARIPFDLIPPDTTLDAHNASFVTTKTVGNNTTAVVEHADLESTTGIKPDVGAAADIGGALRNKAVVWNVFQQTSRADTGEVISASTGKVAMDRVQGSAVNWSGECYADQIGQNCDAGNVTYSGQLFAFPFNTQKKTYSYFDLTLRTPLPMVYQGTETIRGLTTYRFNQVIPDQALTTDSGTISFLMSNLAPKATTGSMWYSVNRTLWIEPTTGSIVNYREAQHRTLRTDAGPPVTIFDATLEYSPQTLATVVKAAGDGRSLLILFGTYVPIGGGLVGVALMVWGYLLTRRAVRGVDLVGARSAYPVPRQPDENVAPAGTVT